MWIRTIRNFLRRFFGIDIIRRPKCLPPTVGENARIHPSVHFSGYIQNIRIGKNVRIKQNVIIRCEDENSSVEIGDGTVLMPFSVILSNTAGHFKIGHSCSVNSFCTLYGGHGRTEIGNFVRIATHSVIVPTNHNFDSPDIPVTHQGHTSEGIRIEDDVWIGAGVKVLDGCRIGRGSVLGAGTVVTKSVDPYSIVVGVPGRVVGRRGEKK